MGAPALSVKCSRGVQRAARATVATAGLQRRACRSSGKLALCYHLSRRGAVGTSRRPATQGGHGHRLESSVRAGGGEDDVSPTRLPWPVPL
jgi:hypothetical protein